MSLWWATAVCVSLMRGTKKQSKKICHVSVHILIHLGHRHFKETELGSPVHFP